MLRNFFFFLLLLLGAALAFALFIAMPAIRDGVNRARRRFYLWNLRMLADTGAVTMAGAPNKGRQGARTGSQVASLLIEHNRLATAMDTLLAKLDVNHGAAADHVATIGGTYSRVAGNDGRDPLGAVVT